MSCSPTVIFYSKPYSRMIYSIQDNEDLTGGGAKTQRHNILSPSLTANNELISICKFKELNGSFIQKKASREVQLCYDAAVKSR